MEEYVDKMLNVHGLFNYMDLIKEKWLAVLKIKSV